MPQTTVTSDPALAFAGMLGDSRPKGVDSFINGESSAEIAFGVAVCQGTLDNEALLPAAAADLLKLTGIVLHSHDYNKDNELGTSGLKPEVAMNVLTHGRVWVVIDEDVLPTSAVRVRHTSDGGGKGTFRKTASANATVDLSKIARWCGTYLAANGVGQIEIDITGRAAVTADT